MVAHHSSLDRNPPFIHPAPEDLTTDTQGEVQDKRKRTQLDHGKTLFHSLTLLIGSYGTLCKAVEELVVAILIKGNVFLCRAVFYLPAPLYLACDAYVTDVSIEYHVVGVPVIQYT